VLLLQSDGLGKKLVEPNLPSSHTRRNSGRGTESVGRPSKIGRGSEAISTIGCGRPATRSRPPFLDPVPGYGKHIEPGLGG
jgi:hypothetical protein